MAFNSVASDLVANDTNGATGDVFVRDLQLGTTTLVSINRFGTGSGNSSSNDPSDQRGRPFRGVRERSERFGGKRYQRSYRDVFVRDLQLGTTTLVSVNRFGTGSGNNSSSFGRFGGPISADGRFVAFTSFASDLVANDTNGTTKDLFVRDLQLGTTTLVSVNRFGTGSGNSSSFDPLISADGRFVAFGSGASDLVANDTNGTQRRVRAGSAAGDDYVGEHQPVWNRVRQWLFGPGPGFLRNQRGRPFRGIPQLCELTWWPTIPTVPTTCSCVLSHPEEVRNSGSFTGVAQSFTAPT